MITCVDIMLNMRNKMKFKEFDDKVSREWLKMEEEISKLTVWSRWKSLLVKGLFEANYIGVER